MRIASLNDRVGKCVELSEVIANGHVPKALQEGRKDWASRNAKQLREILAGRIGITLADREVAKTHAKVVEQGWAESVGQSITPLRG